MTLNISPRLVLLGLIAFLGYLFMYEYPNVLGYPFNFVFVGFLFVVLVALAVRIFRE